MAEILLINPRKRKGRKVAKKTRSAAQRRATAKMLAANRSRRGRRSPAKRRRNPISTLTARHAVARRRPARRRANPVRRIARRRRNPISLGGLTPRSILGQVKDALIGAGGAVAIDVAYGKINPLLPASLQRVPGAIGAGDAVKALLTIAAGKLLSRATRGLSAKAALGALTVQAHGIVSSMLPASLLGYYSPARVVPGTQRVGPMQMNGLRMYTPAGGMTPTLNRYTRGGATQLLSGGAREREGAVR